MNHLLELTAAPGLQPAALAPVRSLRTIVLALQERILRSADLPRDAYLSGAMDAFDLERRIRNWERRPTSFWRGI